MPVGTALTEREAEDVVRALLADPQRTSEIAAMNQGMLVVPPEVFAAMKRLGVAHQFQGLDCVPRFAFFKAGPPPPLEIFRNT